MLTDFYWNHLYDKALAIRNWLSRPDCTIQRAATPAPSGVLSSRTISIPPLHIVRRLCRLPSSRGQWRSTWSGVSSSCPQLQTGDLNSGTPIQYRKLASPVRPVQNWTKAELSAFHRFWCSFRIVRHGGRRIRSHWTSLLPLLPVAWWLACFCSAFHFCIHSCRICFSSVRSNLNYFLAEFDLDAQIVIAKWTRKFWKTQPIVNARTEIYSGFATAPAPATDQQWEEWIKSACKKSPNFLWHI